MRSPGSAQSGRCGPVIPVQGRAAEDWAQSRAARPGRRHLGRNMERFSRRLAALAFGSRPRLAGSAQAQVVISQVYGGGGNSRRARCKNDFIELHNTGTPGRRPDGLDGAVRVRGRHDLASAPTSPGAIAAGRLLPDPAGRRQPAARSPCPHRTPPAPSRWPATAGKVALSQSTTALSGACPTRCVDFVGFGSTANCAEGSAPTADARQHHRRAARGDGCIDSNNNAPISPPVAPSAAQ